MLFDPITQAAIWEVVRHRGFENGVTDEDDERFEGLFRKIKEEHQGTDVELVLMERVPESLFASVDLLSPLGLFLGSKDPAFVIFGFDHADAEG